MNCEGVRRSSPPGLPHALVVPADAEDDGVVGEHTEHQEHGAEPARPPPSEACARENDGRAARGMDDVRPSVEVPRRPRPALPLGHSNGESYRRAEFGVTRAQAYRLLDVARATPRSTAWSPPVPACLVDALTDSEGARPGGNPIETGVPTAPSPPASRQNP